MFLIYKNYSIATSFLKYIVLSLCKIVAICLNLLNGISLLTILNYCNSSIRKYRSNFWPFLLIENLMVV